ncbi:MAG: rhodanese-like domain-containing protein [Actinomycetota bacterium]
MSDVENVDVNSVGGDATILDVREDYEWEAGHIDGAVHIPLNELPLRLEELDPDVDLHVVCRSGGRSFRATEWLNSNGYSAVNIYGGMGAWLDAGKPIVSENGQEPRVQ